MQKLIEDWKNRRAKADYGPDKSTAVLAFEIAQQSAYDICIGDLQAELAKQRREFFAEAPRWLRMNIRACIEGDYVNASIFWNQGWGMFSCALLLGAISQDEYDSWYLFGQQAREEKAIIAFTCKRGYSDSAILACDACGVHVNGRDMKIVNVGGRREFRCPDCHFGLKATVS